MGNYLRRLVVLSGVTAKCRKFWLVAALVPLSLGLSEPALAQTCGPLDAFGSVTCTTGGNPYAGGINYGNTGVPTTVTLEQGVQVFVTPGNGVNQAVAVSTGTAAGTGNPATLIANNVAVTLDGTPGQLVSALFLHPIQGSATITASGNINVAGTLNTLAIQAAPFSSVAGAVATVNWTGDINATGGSNSALIQACVNNACGFGSSADGNANINATGNLTGNFGPSGFGLQAVAAGNGAATVNYNGGTINLTAGSFSNGIFASGGSATITTLLGTSIIVSSTASGASGVEAFADPGATLANVASKIQTTGPAIPPVNDFRFQPAGIRLQSNLGPASVNYTGPGITVQGGGGLGIAAVSGSSGAGVASGSVTVNASGPINITADSSDAVGILADSGTLRNTVRGLAPTLTTGLVQVTASNVSTPGQFGTAISANGGSGGVTVNTSGSIMGGWQATAFTIPGTPLLPGRPPTSVTPLGNISSVSGLPAAGVFLSANGVGNAILTNNGSIGALSDLAIVGNSQVINNGTITGFVKFTGDNNNIDNNGLFNLRHFADTTGAVDASGNGVRDTLRVAVADLGPGTFTNNGTLALPAVTGDTTLDSTGQYLPLGNPNNAMALGGPLQGQLLGVTTFTNSGTIDLQANPAAGDVLLITGGHTPGLNGGGTYISNGGFLKLDTVLNQGDVATRSDTLVIDGTSVGGLGPTNMIIRNAVVGVEALTIKDGILVVQVIDPTRSDPRAFSLSGGKITAGAFDYFLFHGGVTQGSQGNWYLRNELVAPPVTPPGPGEPAIPVPTPAPGTPPLPTIIPGEAPIPLYDPEVPLKSVVPSLARTLGLVTLGTFNERQGDQLLVRGDPNTRVGVWGRVFGQGTREHFAEGARPDFDGTFAGFQAGADLLRLESLSGHRDHIGFYVGQARASGAVHGSVDGFEGAPAGHADLDATSFGGYWTHLGPSNWYIDAVLQGTYFQTSANSIRGFANNFSGRGFAASIEGGYPIPLLVSWLTFEPQIQGIWQRTSFDDSLGEGFSTITYDRSNVFTGRVGALLRGTFGGPGAVWQPYLKGNVWWGSNGFDTVTFDADPIQTRRNGNTTLEGGGGVTGKLASNVSVYGDASYLTSVSGESRITLKGNVGMRVTW